MKQLKTFILAAVMLCVAGASSAQCTFKNTAFKPGEFLSYNLYFNWKFVWVKVGTASMYVVQSKYNGQDAYRASLSTRGNSKMDKIFVMRDTLLCYSSLDLAPLYYRKGALEGKRYTVDEVWYKYPGGKCQITQSRLYKDGRNQIADGNGLAPAKIKLLGTKNVKADNGVRYRCLELSYTEKEKKGWREIARFFVTDDANHVPIRLDMFLKFGSAKAFLTSMRGVKNPINSQVK